MSQELNLATIIKEVKGIAAAGGEIIKATCGNVKSIEAKQTYADLVTETDKNVENFVFQALKERYPDHKFIGEETVAGSDYGKVTLTDDPTWIIDPVDGTTNFVHTFPYVSVSIGLAVKKEPVLGVVNFPLLGQTYWAHTGSGSYCNDDRISVRCSPSLKESLVCVELGSDRSPEKRACVFKNMEAIGWQCHGLRSLGSATGNICSVASGQSNAYYEFGLHCWDICAASVILTEAGGYVCDTDGDKIDLLKRRVLAACSKEIADELSKALVVHMNLPSD